eukprot:29138-Hanusia_phi.AAC.2
MPQGRVGLTDLHNFLPVIHQYRVLQSDDGFVSARGIASVFHPNLTSDASALRCFSSHAYIVSH